MRLFFNDADDVKNEEGFRMYIKKKNRLFMLFAVLGLLMIAVAVSDSILQYASAKQHILDLYCGIGSGLFFVSLVKLVMHRRILHNSELCKAARLRHQDERNITIQAKAMQGAAVTVVMGSYVAMLIGGLFHMMIFWCFWLVIMVYMLAYFIFTGYYRSKM